MSQGQWPALNEIYFNRFGNTVGPRREMHHPIAVGRRMLNCIGIVGLPVFHGTKPSHVGHVKIVPARMQPVNATAEG